MNSLVYFDHLAELLPEMEWIESLAAHEYGIIEPLARWMRDENCTYNEIPPGIRNEVFFKDIRSGETRPSALWGEWGWGEDEMSGLAWIDKAHPDDRPYLASNRKYSEHDGIRVGQSVFRVIDCKGEYHWVLSSAAAIQWSEEEEELLIYVGRDVEISSRVNRELDLKMEIRQAELRSVRERALLEAAGKIAGVTDSAGLLQAVEESVPTILGVDGFRLVAAESGTYRVVLGPGLPEGLDIAPLDAVATASADSHFICLETRSGEEFYTAWRIGDFGENPALALFRSPDGCTGEAERLMAALGPIILRAWIQISDLEVLRRDATTDPLTGIWNRRPFLTQAGRRLRRNSENGNSSAVVLLDIDHFKQINDRHGHPFGDIILSQISKSMGDALRAVDLMCRWGGEEFAVFLDGISGEDVVSAVERLRQAAAKAAFETGAPVSLSAGVRLIRPMDPISLDQALKHADKELLRAKRDGRDCIRLRLEKIGEPEEPHQLPVPDPHTGLRQPG